MSSSSYLIFLHGAREQLPLLSRQASSRSHCALLLNRDAYATFTRCWFGKSASVSTADSGENSDSSETFNVSKVVHRKAQKVKEDVDMGVIQHADTKKRSLYKDHKKKPPTVDAGGAAEYFRQSWLKHYTAVSGEIDHKSNEISHKAHATTKLTEEKEVQRNRRRDMSDFGELSGIMEKDRTILKQKDMRNPNERIGEAIPEDLDEKRDHRLDIPLTRTGRQGKDAFYYTKKISKLGRQGKIREVLDVFEYWMMVRDRVMPRERTFVILIGIMANVGYTDKAFELYGQMRNLGFETNERIYTSLFNACANCPDPTQGLERAENLLQSMKRQGILPNLYTVKAAMKAVALCGDFSGAFALMDEASSRLRIDSECFDHLLMACISDKEAGFRRALQVWQKMGDYRVRPQLSTFNHLIRSARDCGIGDLNSFCSALGINIPDGVSSAELPLLDASGHHPDHSRYSDRTHGRRDSLPLRNSVPKAVLVDSSRTTSQIETDKKQKSHHDNHGTSVDKTAYSENFGIASEDADDELSNLNTLRQKVVSHDKFGARELEWWEDEPKGSGWNEKQDITSSELSINKPTSDLSHETMSTSKSLYSEILTEKPSSLVSNNGMNKLSLKDLTYPHGRLTLLGGAEKIVSVMEEQGLEPELRTYAQLLACLPPNEESEFLLLRMMEERGVKPDIDFFNDIMMRRNRRLREDTVKAVLPVIAKLRLTPNMRTYAALAQTCRKEKQAHQLLQNMKEASLEPNAVVMHHLLFASGSNFVYKQHMLEAMESMGIKPSKNNIAAIEGSIAYAKRRMVEAEKNPHEPNFFRSKEFQRSFQNFLNFYRQWLERNELEKPPHPWNSFKRQEPEADQIPITAESQ